MNLTKMAVLAALLLLAFEASQNGHYRLVEFEGQGLQKQSAIVDSRQGTVYAYDNEAGQWSEQTPFDKTFN